MATRLIGSGQTHTTIADWATTVKALGTLTENEVGELTDSSAYTYGANTDLDFNSVTLDGYTITLKPSVSARHDGSFDSGARVVTSVGFTYIYSIRKLIIEDLQLENTSNTTNAQVIQINVGTEIRRCLIKSASTNSGADGVVTVGSGTGNIIESTRIEMVGGNGILNTNANSTIYNNSVFGAAIGYEFSTAATDPVRNNLAYNCTTDWGTTAPTGTTTNNASEDGTHPGTSGVTISGSPFEADGYTPTTADTQINGAGVDLSITLDAANLNYAATPAIGAYEATAAAGGTDASKLLLLGVG